MIIDKMTEYLQKRLKNKNWFPWLLESIEGGILVTGAECPLKKNGEPNFRKKDKSTIKKIVITSAQFKRLHE